MPIFINKGSEIWPCYSLARNLFKHTYFLLITSLLFTPFSLLRSRCQWVVGSCYCVFQYTGVDVNMCLMAKVADLCCQCSLIIQLKRVPLCLK